MDVTRKQHTALAGTPDETRGDTLAKLRELGYTEARLRVKYSIQFPVMTPVRADEAQHLLRLPDASDAPDQPGDNAKPTVYKRVPGKGIGWAFHYILHG